MDPGYQGLRLPEAGEPILVEHAALMLDSFKKQNKLHYAYAHRIVNDMNTLLDSGNVRVNEIAVPTDAKLIVRIVSIRLREARYCELTFRVVGRRRSARAALRSAYSAFSNWSSFEQALVPVQRRFRRSWQLQYRGFAGSLRSQTRPPELRLPKSGQS